MNRPALTVAFVAAFLVGGLPVLAGDDLAGELPRLKPLTPDEAPRSFQIHPGFQLRAVAVEPLVTDPVAACYDADGRLYVVEMRGYPYPENMPSGNVRRLEDTDGDGTFDRSTIFVDGLSWPTGVVPHDGGVFIAVAPRILYAKDIDGDGVADVNKVVFSGFGTQNVQALVNGLLWGPDGWIYGVSGGNGGDIVNATRPDEKPVSVRGQDFRFRPDGSAFEAVSGGGQFGHAFDDWGHRFTCNNSNHTRQIVLPANYLARSPSLAAPAPVLDIAAEGPAAPVYRTSPPEPWRVVRTRQRVADPAMLQRLPPTERVAAGFFTSATGVTIYRGTAFPPEYGGNAFVGDVGANLVHRKILANVGASFLATRAEPETRREFLASTDNWFRPVNFANTPGGTLLLLDMYRETIEHPASIPDPIKAHLDLTSGKDRGRLYEIVADGAARRPAPRLSAATTAALVAALSDPDGWWRETAQRLLIERRDPAAVPRLRALSLARPTALGRMHALWTLDVLGSLSAEDLFPAMTDPDPRVREQAARLAERHLGESPALKDRLLALADDPDPAVRFQAAFSLGELDDPRVPSALASIAGRDRTDPLVRAAVLSSPGGRLSAFYDILMRSDAFSGPEGRAWIEDVAGLAGASPRPEDRAAVVATLASPEIDRGRKRAAALGLDRGLRGVGGSLRALQDGATAAKLAPLFATAREEAASPSLDLPTRIGAIALLGVGPVEGIVESVPGLLDARQPTEVQLAALAALGDANDARVGSLIVVRWKSLGPSVRREAAEVLFARPDRLVALLDAIEAGSLLANELDPGRRKALLTHPDAALRDRAARLVGEAAPDRARVLDSMRPALALAGDRDRGRAVYLKICASCHRAEGRGEAVGPDLATVAGRTPEDLFLHILDPNREVAPPYLDYRVATDDGRVLGGMIVQEGAASVTLKRAGGVTEVVPRARIEAIASTAASVMPEGLETGMAPRDLADVIAFLRGLSAASPAPVGR